MMVFDILIGQRRVAIFGVVLGAVLGMSAPAMAQYFQGADTTFTSNGTNYRNFSGIKDTQKFSDTFVDRKSAGTTAAGRMGARVRVYESNGNACLIADTSYNTYAAGAWGAQQTWIPGTGQCYPGYIYAKGLTETWNGSGYDFTSTARTVNVLAP